MKRLLCWLRGHRWEYVKTTPLFADLVTEHERCERCPATRATVRRRIGR